MNTGKRTAHFQINNSKAIVLDRGATGRRAIEVTIPIGGYNIL
jgi:hypothetical protein